MTLDILKAVFLPHIQSIRGFHFYYNNPLLWISFIILYFWLERNWGWTPGKAFFFCAAITSVLLGATRLAAKTFTIAGYAPYSLDPLIINIASLVLISLIVVFFVFVDN